MDVIVRGNPHEIDFVRRICRDKVCRGVIAILPATCPASDDVVKLKTERDETSKENQKLRERVAELESQLANVESNVASNVATSDANVDSNVASSDANVASTPEALETISETPCAMDSKYVTTDDDLQEVDLDADVKSLVEDDSKDVPAADAKETKATRKTSKRSKKSE